MKTLVASLFFFAAWSVITSCSAPESIPAKPVEAAEEAAVEEVEPKPEQEGEEDDATETEK